jgi:hypothetical protein
MRFETIKGEIIKKTESNKRKDQIERKLEDYKRIKEIRILGISFIDKEEHGPFWKVSKANLFIHLYSTKSNE